MTSFDRYQPNLAAFLQAAEELLARAGVCSAPTPLELMAGMQYIHYVEPTSSLGTDASLIPYADGYVVLIDAGAPSTRQRFSLAHEIAHTFVGPPHQPVNGEPPIRAHLAAPLSREEEERLCNAAAAELLMPRHLFAAETRKVGYSLGSLRLLAHRFRVSLEAALVRMAEVAEVPVETACWKVGPQAQVAPALAWRAGFGGFDRWFMSDGKARAISDPAFIGRCPAAAGRAVILCDQLRVNGRWATVRSEAKRYGSNGTSSVLTLSTVESWAGRRN